MMPEASMRFLKILQILPVAALVTACMSENELRSGTDFLTGYSTAAPLQSAAEQANKPLTPDEALEIEPSLHFPIKIGLARIEGSWLMPIPAEEYKLWADLAKKLGDRYGQFVVIAPVGNEVYEHSVDITLWRMKPLER